MILEAEIRGRICRHPICPGTRLAVVRVASVMREIARDHLRVRYVRLVVTPDERDQLRDESPQLLLQRYGEPERFMYILLAIEDDPQHRFIKHGRWVTLPPVRPWGLQYALVHRAAFFRDAAQLDGSADDIYRRHGGTQTPPSKRPPSKLHPLVQLDEAIGRNIELGDTDGQASQ